MSANMRVDLFGPEVNRLSNTGSRQEKLPLTPYATQPIVFLNFSNMYKRYHVRLIGVVQQYLLSF